MLCCFVRIELVAAHFMKFSEPLVELQAVSGFVFFQALLETAA